MDTCLKWVQEAESSHSGGHTGHAARLKNLVQTLKGLLNGLK